MFYKKVCDQADIFDNTKPSTAQYTHQPQGLLIVVGFLPFDQKGLSRPFFTGDVALVSKDLCVSSTAHSAQLYEKTIFQVVKYPFKHFLHTGTHIFCQHVDDMCAVPDETAF